MLQTDNSSCHLRFTLCDDYATEMLTLLPSTLLFALDS